MSTYVYLACLDHNPPLIAEDESTQHRYTDSEMAQVLDWVARRDALVISADRDEIDWSNYYLRHTVRFLCQHRACRIAARDEYGEWIDVGQGLPTATPALAHEAEEGL